VPLVVSIQQSENIMREIGVGVCILVVKEKKLLVAERIGHFGKGYLACPGGHQEKNEQWEQTALRELAEEAGSEIKVDIIPCTKQKMRSESNVPLFVTNNVLENNFHYITIWLRANWIAGNPKNTEPNKKSDWQWMTFDEIINDPRFRSGREAWTGGVFHDALHWLPLPELYKYRDRIGI
jgi:8-oxo-dGTP diphosphatase